MVYYIALEEYTNMKDELPSNFKQPSGDADDNKDVTKDDATPTKDDATPTKEEDTPTAEGLVKTAAAAALVSAAVKAKVSVAMLCTKISVMSTYCSI